MVKFVTLLLFYVWLLVPTHLSTEAMVQIQMLPLMEPVTLQLKWAIFAFVHIGILIAMGMALVDQIQLRTANRKLRKELATLHEEVGSLRNMMTMERDS